jgi:hypothetical protein
MCIYVKWRRKRKAFAQSRPEGTAGLVEREHFRVPTPLSMGKDGTPYIMIQNEKETP